MNSRLRDNCIRGSLAALGAVLLMGVAAPGSNAAQPDLDRYLENPAGATGTDPMTAPAPAPRAAARQARGGGSGTFLKGYGEPRFVNGGPVERQELFSRAVEANSNVARINITWSDVAPTPPAEPTNPADPAYDWSRFDQAVVEAGVHGLTIVLTVYRAPAWAEGSKRPEISNEWPRGTWKPRPKAFGQFAQAVATRYSGTFSAGGGSPLPRARYLTAWNESNLTEYLTPQSVRKRGKYRLFAADHYRKLVNAFSDGVARSANPDAEVIAGATSPYGDPVGGRRTRPLEYLRDFLCLSKKLKAQKKCKGGKPSFDIIAHHPITLSGGPHRSAIHRDDVAIPDFKNIVATMRAAEKRNTVKGNRHEAWATEFWWETNPPDSVQGVGLSKHARWVQEGLYLLWKQGASAAIWLQLVDDRMQPDGFSGLQGGHLFEDRTKKPSYDAFRFPFHAHRKSKKQVKVWTIAPATARVTVEKQTKGGWKQVGGFSAKDGVPKQSKVKLKGKQKLRANLGGETTIPVGVKKKG